MSIYKDDRTAEQKTTHTRFVIGIDTFLSGWGPCARGGQSVAAWAVNPDTHDAMQAKSRVRSRSDMKDVVLSSFPPDRDRYRAVHVYVWTGQTFGLGVNEDV